MMERLYVITINWAKSPNTAKIDAVLPGQWLRFSPSSWLLWSTQNHVEIYKAVANVLTTSDSELIMQVDGDNWTGWAQPWIGNWIRSRGTSK